ncbi:hypothetical protein AVEN_184491-1 [Araneus ventricosus]|uniref:Uncharacterized protein n=1 Tax=Araneus ventricosus TaxID=182803 RepID=A0A4Y2BFV0_ARAVE|nr:hypothetical protein AVEN_184491-1 [Araneus ventricosus]
MERTHIKSSFVGFAHRVAPLQNVFHKECFDADLNTDVLEVAKFVAKISISRKRLYSFVALLPSSKTARLGSLIT